VTRQGMPAQWPVRTPGGRCLGWRPASGFGTQRPASGVACAQSGRARQLGAAHRRAGGAEVGVDALRLGRAWSAPQRLAAGPRRCWRLAGAEQWMVGAGLSRVSAALSAVQQAEHGEGAEQPGRGGAGGQVADQGRWGDRLLGAGGGELLAAGGAAGDPDAAQQKWGRLGTLIRKKLVSPSRQLSPSAGRPLSAGELCSRLVTGGGEGRGGHGLAWPAGEGC
jgi:hypothetical protein